MPVPYLNKCLCKTPTQPSKPISKGSSSQRSQPLHQLMDPASCFPSLLPRFAEERSTPLCLQLEGVSLAFPAQYLAPCLAQSGCPKRLLIWNQNGPPGPAGLALAPGRLIRLTGIAGPREPKPAAHLLQTQMAGTQPGPWSHTPPLKPSPSLLHQL